MSTEEFYRRASTNRAFLLKYLIIGVLCFAFFLWSTYDAFIKYPGKVERAKAWEVLLNDESLDDAQRQTEWKEIAKENGWNTKRPKKAESVDAIEQKILWNYLFMAVGLIIAIPNVLWYFQVNNTWIELRGDELSHSDGSKLRANSITKIDKKKWDKKGIALVHYNEGGGENTLVIDDLKFERKATDAIMEHLESLVEREIIVNGKTEKELRAEKEKLIAEAKEKKIGMSTVRNEPDTLVDDEQKP